MRSTTRRKPSKALQWRRPSIEPLERRDLLTVYPRLLKDINLQDDSAPRAFAELNGVTYFRADDGVHGYELWRTDGTAGGTMLVKDTWAGPSSGLLRATQLVRLGNALYFTGEDAGGVELWKTDGTAEGTVLVKDIFAGPDSSSPAQLMVAGSTLFFTIEHPVGGGYLWKSDGTAAGTVEVKDIRGGLGSDPLELTNVNGTLYFSANDGTTGEELWKSDGTEAGTARVADLFAGSFGSFPQELMNVNGTLYFFTVSLGIDRELWKVDGAGVPVLVKDFGSGQAEPSGMTVVGSNVFFSVDTLSEGDELWKSDGTNAGTQMVKDIQLGSGHSAPELMVNVNGTLFFYANDGTSGPELWKSDGSTAGTALVKDIRPGSQGSQFSFVGRSLYNDNGKLIFSANDGTHGPELWTSNGTAAGTLLVNDNNAGPVGSYPAFAANTAGTLYFQANNSIHGWELWKSNGTAGSTSLVKDINTTPAGNSSPTAFVNVGALTYFFATDLVHGWELWVSNTATQGTKLVKDIFPGSAGSYSSLAGSRIGMGNVFYFAANDGTSGTELWRSDGTAAGTYLLKDIHPTGSSSPVGLTVVGNTLFFLADNGTNGAELWKTDGTTDGTTMVQDLRPGPSGSNPVNLVNVNGVLYFTANDGTTGIEIWKSDGTGGITLLKDIRPGASVSSQVTQLTNASGALYFTASESGTVELWKSDGSSAGTAPVRRSSEGGPANPSSLTNVNGVLMFVGNRSPAGFELWKSDGTLAGTVQVKDINPGSATSNPTGLTAVGNLLMFFANDGTTGKEIWKSDGTTEGTLRLRDIRPGVLDSIGFFAPSIPAPIAAVGNLFYFAANDGTTGTELWQTDGTVDGTFQVADLQPGAASSAPARLVNSAGSLYFQASNGTNGAEPWVLTSLIIDYFSSVTGRRIFYNQSKFDGGSPAINAADDNAIAADKFALQFTGSTTAPLSAFTSYSRGINGIMIDVSNLAGELSLDDFTFKVGANGAVASWTDAPAPNGFSVRPGAGVSGSDRIVITWPNNAIQNTWLQVIVEGNDTLGGHNNNTGLASSDVFFFGNRIGDTFISSPATVVSTAAADSLAARNNPGVLRPITNPYDFDRNQTVSAGDELIARTNSGILTRNLTWTPPAGPLAAQSLAAVDGAAEDLLLDDTAQTFGTLAAALASTLATRRHEPIGADAKPWTHDVGLERRTAAWQNPTSEAVALMFELGVRKKSLLVASEAQASDLVSSLLEALSEHERLE